MNIVEELISHLFAARDTVHLMHLRTKSFSQHVALNDLYDALLESADSIAEIYQGKYGIMKIPNPQFNDTEYEPVEFVTELADWAEASRASIAPEDTNLLNEWDTLISAIFRAKYKLVNLA